MNKKLIALAIAAGLAAPMAANAAPTVYGKAHVSFDSLDDGVDSNMNVSDNASRLGFKGSEDLGGGMSAIYKYELAVNIDTGGHSGGRNHYVGLKGNFGTLRLGYEDSPLKNIRSKSDLFGDQIGDFRNFTRPTNATGSGGNNWDERFDNMVRYTSPKLGGSFVIDAAYSTNFKGGSTASGPTGNDTDAMSIGLTFNVASLRFMLATETHNLTTGTGDESALRAGVQWKSGPMVANFIYQSASDQGGVAGADRDVMGANFGYKMGKNMFKIQYAMADDYGSITDSGASMIAVGVNHSLSKTTTVYLDYASTSNDANAAFSASGGGGHESNVGAAANGQDPSGISVGIIHNF